MARIFIVVALVLAAAPAAAQLGQRDRTTTRFENDIRSNNEAMSRRFNGRSYEIDTQNTRLRERLNTTRGGSGLRRLPE
jgi:hypothetical protein